MKKSIIQHLDNGKFKVVGTLELTLGQKIESAFKRWGREEAPCEGKFEVMESRSEVLDIKFQYRRILAGIDSEDNLPFKSEILSEETPDEVPQKEGEAEA